MTTFMPKQRRAVRRALVVALCAGLLAPVVRAQQAAPRVPLEDKYVESDGAMLRYVDVGRGETVVLIHGFAANLDLNWVGPRIVATLSKDFRVVAFDCRGHGKSGKPHDAASYGTKMVNDIANLLDHLGVRRAHVVGYSMGANIAARFVTLHPDRAATVTLGGSGGHRGRADEHQRDDEELASSLEQGKGMLPLLRRLAPPGEPAPPELALELASRAVMARNDPLALAAVARGRHELAVGDEELKAVRVPLLAVVGTADPALRGVQELKDLLPRLQVVTIEGATHVGPPRGAPSRPEFVAAVRSFIASHSAMTSP